MIASLRNRRALATLAVVALVVEVSGCNGGESDEPLPKSGSDIIVGVKNNQPGLSEILPGKDQPIGFEPSLAKRLLTQYKTTVTPVSVGGWQKSLQHTDMAMAFSSISVNGTRRKDFIFAGPYLRSPMGALTEHGKSISPNTLSGLKVCYLNNTTAAALVEDESKRDASIGRVPKDTTQDCLDAVNTSAADIFLSDKVILLGLINHHEPRESPQYGLIDESSLRNASPQSYGIALRRQEKALCRELDKKLNAELQDPTGDWAKIFISTVTNGSYNVDDANRFKPDEANVKWCD